ncbi:hypothetical protein C922_04111 [Plasmodium inui San Antonio 1]|uniref:Uncharacterized protein n=1 Tax=Plasmodium inui San Antonio 1 TaxID=1237626 RepID=W7A1R8_9APIC|nr:hypothetical protein C922_04111 [Plasmodium inui San Antonio 1]EUD65605.1 hypothetical protein C922_04111 [Plasmodium inui San Antonio 1]
MCFISARINTDQCFSFPSRGYEAITCKRSQGEDTAETKDAGKAEAECATTNEAKTVGRWVEKGPKVGHAKLGVPKGRKANKAKAEEAKAKQAQLKSAQPKRVQAKGDHPESDRLEGDRFKREHPQNAQHKTTRVGCTLKKVAEGSDSDLGEEPLEAYSGAIPWVKSEGGIIKGGVYKEEKRKGERRKDEKGKAEKRKGEKHKERDIKTRAHKKGRREGTPRRSHRKERQPQVCALLDGSEDASALSCAESSTLSLASGTSENSSLYWGEDNLIEIFIGQAKLKSQQTDCSHYEQAFCVSYFVYEDPLEIFSLFQGVSWLPELRNRCTSLNRIEFKPKENIKKTYSSAYININQCVHLRRRHNEVLNIVDDGIAYVFISIIGVNLKEYEQFFYQSEYATIKGGTTSPPGTSYIRSDVVKPLNRFYHPGGIIPNMDEEYQRGVEDIPFGKNLAEKYKKEIESELDSMREKKIVIERDYKKFLHILGSSIVPIKVSNEGELKKVENMCTKDSYNVYPHEVIRAIFYNYIDLFRKNKKANLFHLISKHEEELLPVGRLNIQSKEVKKDVLPPGDLLHEEDIFHNLSRSNGGSDAHNVAKKILKYVTVRRTSRGEEEDSFVKEIKKLFSHLVVELNKKYPKRMNQSFSYFEKSLHKMDDMNGQEKFRKKIRKKLFKMLGLSKRRFQNELCPAGSRISEVPCSHLIVYVHCVSNIALKLSSLKDFTDVKLFHGIIFWEEEGNSLHNLQNLSDRKRRTIRLTSQNGIQVDYYCATECEQQSHKVGGEKQDVVCLKLNFNSPVILPYNYNASSCRLNFVLLHRGIPLLRLGESGRREDSCNYDVLYDNCCYAINDKTPFNEGDKVKRTLQIHRHYLKTKGHDPFTESSRPSVEFSFYTHPKNSTFFSEPKYKLLYKNRMKSNLGEDITHSAYSAPNFGRDKLVFHFFDDFADDPRLEKANRRCPFKSYFFVPVMGREMQERSPVGKRGDTPSRHAQSYETPLRNAPSSAVRMHGQRGASPLEALIQVVHLAVAEGGGLKGGEINSWHSFYVHTKNYRKKKIYGGKHVQIRIQIEPLGYLHLDYGADPCRDGEVNKKTLTCYAPNKGLMGSDKFCFNSFSEIHELVDYKVEDLKNGTYEVTYQVHKVGRKLLYIFCDGIDVVGSPYEIEATPSDADPKSCKILGKGATQCLATPVLDLDSGPWVGGRLGKQQYENGFVGGEVNRDASLNGDVAVNQGGHLEVSIGAPLSSIYTKAGLVPSGGNLDGSAPPLESSLQLESAEPGGSAPEANVQKGFDGTASAGGVYRAVLPVEGRPGETHPSFTASATATPTSAPTAVSPQGEHQLHIISVTKREVSTDLGAPKTEEVSDQCASEEASGSRSSARRIPYCSDEANKLFSQPKYYDEIEGENITKMDKANKQRCAEILEETQIVNTFTVILCDKNGVKLSIGNDNVKVVGKNGAQIKRLVDNNNGSYTVEYVAHFKREGKTKKMFDDEDIKQVQTFYEEFLIQCSKKHNDNYLIEDFQRRFHQGGIPICCQIHVYINEVEMFGSPLKPIIMNIPQILHFFNLYFQFTYSGLLLKSFELLLNCNDYQGCMSSLSSFYSTFLEVVESEQGRSKSIDSGSFPTMIPFVSPKGSDDEVKAENFFFNIPLNIFDLRKGALVDSSLPVGEIPHGHTKWGEQQKGAVAKYTKGDPLHERAIHEMNESSFVNEWLHMHMHKSKLSKTDAKYDLGMNLAYSLSNIILQHLIYLKQYKFFINSKQYENGLLQDNILTHFRKLLEEEYNKMFAYQTKNIIQYCEKIENVKFSGLEELIKVYKGIASELRKLKKNDLADDFDKCCEHMCQELYLHNIECSLLRKEAMLDKYEQVIDQKMEKVDQIKERLKKYERNEVDMERISKMCSVKRDKGIQTNDYLSLSHKNNFLTALIESRKDKPSAGEGQMKNEQTKQFHLEETQIRDMVRKYWRNASTYDIFVSIKKTMNNCPRLKTSLDETFNYYSCSVKKENKMKEFQIKKMQEIKMVENLDNLKMIDLNEDNNNLLSHNDLSTFHLTYNAYVAFLVDLRCNKFFIKDLENVLWLFEKFSIQHHSFRNLYNPYGFLRVIPKYFFIAFVRELSYLNMLYVISECVVTNNEDEKIFLNINHPSRLSAFHHFVKYHFVPFYEELSLEPNFQNFKQNLIEYNEEEVDPDSTRDTWSSGGGVITTTTPHINPLDLETYFNNELPLLVRHRNFEKTFPLLFDYYSELSSPRGAPFQERAGATTQGEVVQGQTISDAANKDNSTNIANQVVKGETAPCPEKHVSVAIFIRFLREFGLIPHFFSNQMAIQTLQGFMQKKGKKKLNYEDFSHAIIISICECVKKNILTQYNMLKVNNQLNSKIQTEKILNRSYIQYEAKELIYLFGFADMELVRSKLAG